MSEALRLAAWMNEGAWHAIRLGDVEAAGHELRRLAGVEAELQQAREEVESLKLAEEGAKEAFGHVVQEKRDLEKALQQCEANLRSAHEIIRSQAKAKFLEVKNG